MKQIASEIESRPARKFDESSSEFFDYFVQLTGEHQTKEMRGLAAIMFYWFLRTWNNIEWVRN